MATMDNGALISANDKDAAFIRAPGSFVVIRPIGTISGRHALAHSTVISRSSLISYSTATTTVVTTVQYIATAFDCADLSLSLLSGDQTGRLSIHQWIGLV